MTEKPCLYAKPKTPREKGCKSPAMWRVVLGKGYFIDVCDLHVGGYRGMGYKILKLEEIKV